MDFPKVVKIALHSSKSGNAYEGERIGLSPEAIDRFVYALYEVEFTLKVEADGSYEVLEVDGRPLGEPNDAQT